MFPAFHLHPDTLLPFPSQVSLKEGETLFAYLSPLISLQLLTCTSTFSKKELYWCQLEGALNPKSTAKLEAFNTLITTKVEVNNSRLTIKLPLFDILKSALQHKLHEYCSNRTAVECCSQYWTAYHNWKVKTESLPSTQEQISELKAKYGPQSTIVKLKTSFAQAQEGEHCVLTVDHVFTSMTLETRTNGSIRVENADLFERVVPLVAPVSTSLVDQLKFLFSIPIQEQHQFYPTFYKQLCYSSVENRAELATFIFDQKDHLAGTSGVKTKLLVLTWEPTVREDGVTVQLPIFIINYNYNNGTDPKYIQRFGFSSNLLTQKTFRNLNLVKFVYILN